MFCLWHVYNAPCLANLCCSHSGSNQPRVCFLAEVALLAMQSHLLLPGEQVYPQPAQAAAGMAPPKRAKGAISNRLRRATGAQLRRTMPPVRRHGTKEKQTAWLVSTTRWLKHLQETPPHAEAATTLVPRLPVAHRAKLNMVLEHWCKAVSVADKLRDALANAERHLDEVAEEVPRTILLSARWQAAGLIPQSGAELDNVLMGWASWKVHRSRQPAAEHATAKTLRLTAIAQAFAGSSNVSGCSAGRSQGHNMVASTASQPGTA